MNAALEKLTEQINDEFLTCKICFEPFKQPKCLSCLHTFCKDCIESHLFSYRLYKYSDYRDFSCPICRKKTQIPFGGVSRLQDNFIVSSLTELIGDTHVNGKTAKIDCDFCSRVKNKGIEATVKCMDCQKVMCEECAQAHQENPLSREHDCYELAMEKDVICPDHPGEPVRYFCDDCEQCVCIVCTCHAANLHKDHRLTSFKQAADKRRPCIVESLKLCKTRERYADTYIRSLKNLNNRLKQARQDIHKTAEQFQEQIANQAEKCIEELESRVGAPCLESLKELDSLEKYHEHLSNTCSLTELMLAGREIELLLMTKQLSVKLKDLSVDQLKPLPPEVKRDFQFVRGTVDFGALVFADEINGERRDELKEKKGSTESNGIAAITTAAMATQTDSCLVLDLADDSCDCVDDDSQAFMSPNQGQDAIGMRAEEFVAMSKLPENGDSRGYLETLSQEDGKYAKQVRRIIKKNCSVATLPNKDIIILDPECNCVSFLDKRGRTKYFLSSDKLVDPRMVGIGSFKSFSVSDKSTDRSVTIQTPQGSVVISLKEPKGASLPIGFTVHAYNSMSAVASTNNTESSELPLVEYRNYCYDKNASDERKY